MKKDLVLVLAGPTAVGKTALSLGLAEHFGAEIISADSMQVYKGMDIGTAKATPREQARVPHHMIDVADPALPYSVADYVGQAGQLLQDILARGGDQAEQRAPAHRGHRRHAGALQRLQEDDGRLHGV